MHTKMSKLHGLLTWLCWGLQMLAWVSEWMLFNAKWVMFQLCYSENKLPLNSITLLGNMILILSQPVYALIPKVVCRDATNTNLIVFGFTWSGLTVSTFIIYYTNDAVKCKCAKMNYINSHSYIKHL